MLMPHLKVGAQKWTATTEQLTNELTLAIGTLKPTFQLKKKKKNKETIKTIQK